VSHDGYQHDLRSQLKVPESSRPTAGLMIVRLVGASLYLLLAFGIYIVFLRSGSRGLAENVRPSNATQLALVALGVLAAVYVLAGLGQLALAVRQHPLTTAYARWSTVAALALTVLMPIVLMLA
jgi:hypothetical protein